MIIGIYFHRKKFENSRETGIMIFNYLQSSARDERIYFNFTENKFVQGGANRLLEVYGVSMLLKKDDPLRLKLKSIGKPMIVRYLLDPS